MPPALGLSRRGRAPLGAPASPNAQANRAADQCSPLDSRVGRRQARRPLLDGDMQNKPLADRSILIVEDDIILSTDLAFAMTEAGCKAVVPTTANAAALAAMV